MPQALFISGRMKGIIISDTIAGTRLTDFRQLSRLNRHLTLIRRCHFAAGKLQTTAGLSFRGRIFGRPYPDYPFLEPCGRKTDWIQSRRNCRQTLCRQYASPCRREGINLCKGLCPMAKSLQDRQIREAVVYLHHKQGHRVPVSIKVVPIVNDKGVIVGALEVFLQQKDFGVDGRLKELARTAYIDQITGLFNKSYLETKLKSVVTADSLAGNAFGLLAFDVANLKEINEENGPQAGNTALQVSAKTLSVNLSPDDVAGRWFGGRFLVLTNTDNKSLLLNWAHKLKALIEQSDIPGFEDIHLQANVGGIQLRPDEPLEWIESRLEEQLRISRSGRNSGISIQS